MRVDLAVNTTINVDKTILGLLSTSSSRRRNGLVAREDLPDEIVGHAGGLLSHGLRRDWRSPGIPRLMGNHAWCRPAVGRNTWSCTRVDSIRVGDSHGSRSSRCRGRKGGSGCSIARHHSVCIMLIDLVATSFLQASKFSLPFRLSHLLEDSRRDKIGVLFTIPSKEDFGVRRGTRRRGCQRGFPALVLTLAS